MGLIRPLDNRGTTGVNEKRTRCNRLVFVSCDDGG